MIQLRTGCGALCNMIIFMLTIFSFSETIYLVKSILVKHWNGAPFKIKQKILNYKIVKLYMHGS